MITPINTALRLSIGVVALLMLPLGLSAGRSTRAGSTGAASLSLTLDHPMPIVGFIQPERFAASGWVVSMLPAGFDTVDSSATGAVLLREHTPDPRNTVYITYWRWLDGNMERLEKTTSRRFEHGAYINDRGEIASAKIYPESPYNFSLVKVWVPTMKSFEFSWKCPLQVHKYEDIDIHQTFEVGYATADLMGLDGLGKIWVLREMREGEQSVESIDRSGQTQEHFRGAIAYPGASGGISKGGHWYFSYGQWASIIDGVVVWGFPANGISANGIALYSSSFGSAIRYPDGTIDDGPNAQNPNWIVTWVDDQDRLVGIRLDEAGNRISCIFTRKKDSDGELVIPSEYEFEDFVPFILANGWTTDHLIAPGAISPQLGLAKRTRGDGSVEERAFLALRAPQLAVDADRDGTIKLATEDASDATSAEKPYRFWLNDDIDLQAKSDPASAGDENPYSGTKNWNDNVINGLRDLEDFTRLNLYLGGLQDAVVSGQIKVGLKWKNPDRTTPSIKVWRNLSPNGGREYLTDVDVAGQHLSLRDPGLVKDAITYIIPTQYWTDVALSASQPYGNLLFEGCSTGKGQLVMVLLNSNDTEIGEGASVWIELKHFNELYEHWTCGDTDLRDAVIASTADHPYGSPFEYGEGYDGLSVPGATTYNDYVLFVHGWRMQPWERRAFAETAFKRMHHQGYKGKFGFFSWPTEWVDLDNAFITTTKNALSDPQHYDRSEVVARKSGAVPLHALLVSLNNRFGADHLHVFAHSMGNVVVSEALRAHQASTPVINRYIACQSAEVAHTYDQNAAPGPFLSQIGPLIPDLYRYNPPNPRTEPEQWKEGDNYHKGLATRTNNKFVSFANLNDQALGKWDLNQVMKPDDGLYPSDTAYKHVWGFGNADYYWEDPPGLAGSNQEHQVYWPADRFTILAHIISARSRATGATSGIGGEFNPAAEVNLDAEAYQFGGGDYSHSAEFLSNFAQRRTFYFRLLESFGLVPDDL